mmetsp:Transcript_70990/g.203486  ORF Transcript_70990/g.203486 Transcript_70990/m.203486 type:complete len:228 (+) Transcript_70990:2939-3622(+)
MPSGRRLQQKTTKDVGLRVRKVLVRHHVRPHDHQSTGDCGELQRLRVLSKGVELQGALDRAQHRQHHDPAPRKGRQPRRGLVLGQLRRLVRRQARLVHAAEGPLRTAEAHRGQHLPDEGGGLVEGGIDLQQAWALGRGERPGAQNLRRAFGAEQAVADQSGHLREAAVDPQTHCLAARRREELGIEPGIHDAEALAGEVHTDSQRGQGGIRPGDDDVTWRCGHQCHR